MVNEEIKVNLLEKAANTIKNRATERDQENGERSMKRCVEAFNTLEGTSLTEVQGWRFMIMLKLARATAGKYREDDYIDMAAYAALSAECLGESEATVTLYKKRCPTCIYENGMKCDHVQGESRCGRENDFRLWRAKWNP